MKTSVLPDPEFPAFCIHWECELRRAGKATIFLHGELHYPALAYDAMPGRQTQRRLVHALMRNGIYPLRKTRRENLR